MTTSELEALQKLAQSHGGSLTINPKTGLPEAGFLSSILPTVAGIGLGIATGNPFLAAAIVGGTSYAVTGSLGEGLMAGLGAWSGANLAGSISKAATTSAITDASQMGNAVSAATNATIPTNIGMGGVQGLTDTTLGGIVGSGQALGTQAAQAGMTAGEYLAANPGLAQTATAAGTAAAAPSNWDTFKSGFGEVTKDWKTAKDFAMENKMDVFGTAMPFVRGIAQEMRPEYKDQTPQYNNPAGFARISKDFRGSNPNPPEAYTPRYPDYAVNPYIPQRVADGGLLDVENMADGGVSGKAIYDVFNAQNVRNAKQNKAMFDAIAENAKENAMQTFEYEKDYEGMNPYQRAHAMVANMHKRAALPGKPKTREMSGLGSISTDPAMVSQAQIAQQAQQPTDAKEGGVISPINYASGGTAFKKINNAPMLSGVSPFASKAKGDPVSSSTLGGMAGQPTSVPGNKGAAKPANGNAALGNTAIEAMMAAKGKGTPVAPTTPQQPNPVGPVNIDDINKVYIPQYEDYVQRPYERHADGGQINYAMGGLSSLGSYSDGGRLLRGPGDGVSDSIPATIGDKQPARLAEGEFVIPARIVSELGNGSTDAGAKRLYAMMDRIKHKRAKTKNIAADTKAYKYLPA
jgi:hypothetical protein